MEHALHILPAHCLGSYEKPRQFTNPFCYEPHPWCVAAAEEVKRYVHQNEAWAEELSLGKMFGVLVGEKMPKDGETDGNIYFLAAFSGLFCGENNIPYFVPPIYDLLKPDGHFQQEQDAITAINRQVEELEKYGSVNIRPDLYTPEEREAVITLKHKRKAQSIALQDWLFHQYYCLNFLGERKNITEIFLDYYRQKMLNIERFQENADKHHIPSGTGECCAPKLLQYAYEHELKPLCMAEWWMGASPREEVRFDNQFYPACTKKCRPLLHFMLQGLEVEESFLERRNRELLNLIEIVYEDDHLIVINKPSGLLSVPSRDAQVSILDWSHGEWIPAHRLDQDTSGLLLIAKNHDTLINLQKQFYRHGVQKKYIALVDGKPQNKEGVIDLPLSKNPVDPPRQIVDYVHGKRSVTRYEVLDIQPKSEESADYFSHQPSYISRVAFYPETGRTHQLRMHAAHADGLACPILGDKLYGRKAFFLTPASHQAVRSPRLMLHASAIDFTHPVTGEAMHIESPCPF